MLLRKRRAWRPTFTSNRVARNRYRFLSRKCDLAIRRFYDRNERLVLTSGNSSRFFRYVQRKKTVRQAVPPMRRFDGTLAISDSDKAQVLNNFFSSVFTTDNRTSPAFPARTNATLSRIDFPLCAVVKKLRGLKKSTSTGPDGIPNILLSNLASTLAEPLAFLFDFSFASGSVPEPWRAANVVPIFKKGTTSDPSNYRPVSLTCTSCRVMESIVKDAINSHLAEYSLISDLQHGFRARQSTTTQLLECLDVWTKWARDKVGGHCVYIDFAKAFDSVSHSKLLLKLSSYGIRGSLLKWIDVYLSNRRQRVRVGDAYSTWLPVTSGVPQGSVLGPLLFLIYVNDLVDQIPPEVAVRLFADDVKLFAHCANTGALQRALDRLHAWALLWQLGVSIPKCAILPIGHEPTTTPADLTLNGIRLETVTECRDLGVTVSGTLKFSAHCHSIANKASKVLGILFRCFRTANVEAHVKAYTAFVRPILEFSCQVWNPHSVGDSETIEKVQRLFTRRLFFRCKMPYEEYDGRLKRLNLERLSLRRLHADLSMFHQIINRQIRISRALFTFSGRNDNRVLKDNCRVNARLNFFSNRIATPWNHLVRYYPSVVAMSNVGFRSKIKTISIPA